MLRGGQSDSQRIKIDSEQIVGFENMNEIEGHENRVKSGFLLLLFTLTYQDEGLNKTIGNSYYTGFLQINLCINGIG